jgi:PIN domain nuclease of toxin-antitoxin system
MARREPLAFSAVSLLEIAALEESGRIEANLYEVFDFLRAEPSFELLPVTYDIAEECSRLHSLRDPGDRAIVATARVHRLKLLTSDQRIIESKLVAVVE